MILCGEVRLGNLLALLTCTEGVSVEVVSECYCGAIGLIGAGEQGVSLRMGIHARKKEGEGDTGGETHLDGWSRQES